MVTKDNTAHNQVVVDLASKELHQRRIVDDVPKDDVVASNTDVDGYRCEAIDWLLSSSIIGLILVIAACEIFYEFFFPLTITRNHTIDVVISWMLIIVAIGISGMTVERFTKMKMKREQEIESNQKIKVS